MAIDSAQKRFAIAGNVFPVAANDSGWRATVARIYPLTFPNPVEVIIGTLANVLTAARIAPDLAGVTVIPDSPHITSLRSST